MGGALFGYFVVFPIGFKFFLSFGSETLRPLPSIKEYLSLSAKLLIAFGVIFELPVFLIFLSKIGVVDAPMLSSHRKYVIVIVFIVGALLTPPDVITQTLMAVPILILYEASIVMVKLVGRKKEDRSDSEAE